MGADARIAQLGLELPPPPAPAGVYQLLVITGKLVYLSGHGPLLPDGTMLTGKVGKETDVEGGYRSARQTGLSMLSTLRGHLKTLDTVSRVVKVLGMVNCAPDFKEHPAVINGASELFRDVFGDDAGVGARSAVGMGSLPGNITTEIEAIFELR